MGGTPTRLVVRPPNWLGDAVMALPALAAIRRHFAGAHLTVAAAPAVATLFREETDVFPDAVVDLPASTRDASARLAEGRFDLGVLLPNSWRSAWQFRRAGIPERWGFGSGARRLLLSQAVARPRARMHQADYYRHLVCELGVSCPPDELPRLAPLRASLDEGTRLLGGASDVTPLVGVAPGAAYGQAKQWPPDRLADVLARLVHGRGASCVLVGAGHDRDAGRAIESWLRANAPDASGRVLNLIGRTSLRALVGVLAQTDVVVANDSGAMHLAAALGRPVVAVFGPTDDRATRPLGDAVVLTASVFCRPCMLRDCPIDHRCMKRITTDRVYHAVAAGLDERAGRS